MIILPRANRAQRYRNRSSENFKGIPCSMGGEDGCMCCANNTRLK